jgi:hypothetical protein
MPVPSGLVNSGAKVQWPVGQSLLSLLGAATTANTRLPSTRTMMASSGDPALPLALTFVLEKIATWQMRSLSPAYILSLQSTEGAD